LADGIVAGGFGASGERLADDEDAFGAFGVVFGEVAPSEERGADGVEILRGDDFEVRFGEQMGVSLAAFEFEAIVRIPADGAFEGAEEDGGGAGDFGGGAEAGEQVEVEAAAGGRVDFRASQGQVHGQRFAVGEAGIGAEHGLVADGDEEPDGEDGDRERGLGEDEGGLEALACACV